MFKIKLSSRLVSGEDLSLACSLLAVSEERHLVEGESSEVSFSIPLLIRAPFLLDQGTTLLQHKLLLN